MHALCVRVSPRRWSVYESQESHIRLEEYNLIRPALGKPPIEVIQPSDRGDLWNSGSAWGRYGGSSQR